MAEPLSSKAWVAAWLPVDIVALQRGTPGSAFARIVRSRAQPLEITA